jgi:phenylacetate-CoA ligase
MSDAGSPNIYQQFAATLERTEWLARVELDSYREHLLKRLVTFAAAQSPFYRERLKPLFRSGPEPQLDAWSEIPLLRRQELASDIGRINPASVPDEVGAVSTVRTSGTTGERATFQTCVLARVAAECMMHRHYCWHALDLTAPMASVRFFSSGRRTCPQGITEQNWSAIKPGANHHTIDVREPVGDIIAWLAQRAPKYLLTFPSMMHDLAHHPDAAAVAALKLGKIIGISESLTPYVRDIVQERFDCEIAQIYACAEMGCIALQVPGDDHYLACEETVFLEILDDDGNQVTPGQTGRVVLTSFYNYATPFIRYEIGDHATLAAAPCPSGRALMRLARIDGRARNALRALSGRRVWPHEIPIAELAAHLSSSRFQIRQPDNTSIEVIFAAQRHARPADQKQVAAVFARIMGGELDVRLTAVNDLTRTAGGKRELVVSMAQMPRP